MAKHAEYKLSIRCQVDYDWKQCCQFQDHTSKKKFFKCMFTYWATKFVSCLMRPISRGYI